MARVEIANGRRKRPLLPHGAQAPRAAVLGRGLLTLVAALAALVALPVSAAAAAGSWTIVSSPNTSAGQDNGLTGVACVNADDCWAVGEYYTGPKGYTAQTLIEHDTGSGWTIVSSPTTGAGDFDYLAGVTCVSASECWAVGFFGTSQTFQTLVERYDGTAWTIVTSPNAGANPLFGNPNILTGVTCVGADDCWAVGYYYNAYLLNYVTLIEHYDGSGWTVASSPNAPTLYDNYLYGVTCVSASDCWAVGEYYPAATGVRTLIEKYDGASWSLVTLSPNPATGLDSNLTGVACASAAECWAVGESFTVGATWQTLIEQYDGMAWTVVNSPNGSSLDDNFLRGVTCASTADCWAVGVDNNGTADVTLIEQDTGSGWAIATSPNVSSSGSQNGLEGVACVNADDCWAVGGYYISGSSSGQTLVEQYTTPSPPVGVPDLPWPPLALLGALVGGAAVGVRGGTWRLGAPTRCRERRSPRAALTNPRALYRRRMVSEPTGPQ